MPNVWDAIQKHQREQQSVQAPPTTGALEQPADRAAPPPPPPETPSEQPPPPRRDLTAEILGDVGAPPEEPSPAPVELDQAQAEPVEPAPEAAEALGNGNGNGHGNSGDGEADAALIEDIPPAVMVRTPPAAAPGQLAGHLPLNGQTVAPELVAHHDRGGAVTEQYRSLRTNLLARYPDERFCIAVTSAEAGEGKTITALNLSVVLAERQDRTVVVVDADLRKRRIAQFLGVPPAPGVVELLRGQASLSDVIRPTAYPNLFIVTAGKTAAGEVGGLVGRPELQDLLLDLRRSYDCVLVDCPPVTIASDAGVIGRAAGEALLVFRMNRTRRESAERAMRLLHAADVKLVGMVLTHQKYYIPNYLYRYA